jgi:hypothetical protein
MKCRSVLNSGLILLGATLLALSSMDCASAAQGEAMASGPAPWLGTWLYKKLYFREQTMPPMNPNLRLYFEFREDGTDRVYWRYEGEAGFCERLGRYRFEEGVLIDEITWVNPANAPGCSRDPDMQEGRKTRTPAEVHDSGEFWLHLSLSGEDLVYIFERHLRATDSGGPVAPVGTALASWLKPCWARRMRWAG